MFGFTQYDLGPFYNPTIFFNENQSKVIKQAKLTYSPGRKTFEKQTKSIKEFEEKQIQVIKDQGKNKSNL